MMNKKITALMLIASIVSAGCASSVAVPVPVAQVGDETKSCDGPYRTHALHPVPTT